MHSIRLTRWAACTALACAGASAGAQTLTAPAVPVVSAAGAVPLGGAYSGDGEAGLVTGSEPRFENVVTHEQICRDVTVGSEPRRSEAERQDLRVAGRVWGGVGGLALAAAAGTTPATWGVGLLAIGAGALVGDVAGDAVYEHRIKERAKAAAWAFDDHNAAYASLGNERREVPSLSQFKTTRISTTCENLERSQRQQVGHTLFVRVAGQNIALPSPADVARGKRVQVLRDAAGTARLGDIEN